MEALQQLIFPGMGAGMNKTDLNALRQQIDELDDQIHELLVARFDVTARVAAAKGAQSDPSLIPRPVREREILERLRTRDFGLLPRGSMTRIWKEIMGAACYQQGDFRVGVCAEAFSELSQVAREHFGTAVPLEFGASSYLIDRLFDRNLALLVFNLDHKLPVGLHQVGELRSNGKVLGRLISIHNLEA